MGRGSSRTTNDNSNHGDREEDLLDDRPQPVGIYGWRKRCLYGFILLLIILTVLNLALLVWMLRVLNFNWDGVENVKYTEDGMRIEGQVEFLDSLYTEKIQSLQSKPLKIDSSRGVHIRARNEDNNITNNFVIANKTVSSQCELFEIKNSKGQTKLSVSNSGVHFGNMDVTFTGSSKVNFTGSIATPNVRGPVSEPLRVEALSTQLRVVGDQGVYVTAPAGKILIKSANQLSLIASKNMYLQAKDYYIKKPRVSSPQSGSPYTGTVYELCICETGRLFLSQPNSDCKATDTICQ
ncbi:zeta-sarcoglycan-like [Mytilus californianus]|uniref:zeta-sarcoglycan-like n=1 Tax=Mytilus californianus TaxID=6549 RepID=UPI0022475471|nr:zeta-sarcoglycan-like [Mytilus californianus]XP_052076906.1 zeta-sarcoglycan-like [Mytilus californianus]